MNWGRKSHFKRIGPRESVGAHPCTCKSLLLQAASVFRGHGSRPNRAEGNLYVHASRPGRAEVALYVQPPCLDVHIILCTVKLSRNSIYWYIGSENLVSRTPPFKCSKNSPNDVFSTTKTTFSGWGSVSRFRVAKIHKWISDLTTNLYIYWGQRWNQLYKPTKDQQKLPRVTAFMGARHWKNENQ